MIYLNEGGRAFQDLLDGFYVSTGLKVRKEWESVSGQTEAFNNHDRALPWWPKFEHF